MSELTTTAIPIFDNLPPRSWAIPVPKQPSKDRPYVSGSRSAEDIEKELLALGFERAVAVNSFSHFRVRQPEKWRSEDEKPLDYVLWTHPAGVAVRAHTYHTSNGNWNGPAENRTPVTTFETLDVYFALLFPEGRERRHQSGYRMKGSGGIHTSIDGSSVRIGSDSIKPTQEGMVGDLLRLLQANGRFLPFEKWPPTHYVYVDAEFVMPFPDRASLPVDGVAQGVPLDEAYGSSRVEAAEAFLETLPEGLRMVVRRALLDKREHTRQWNEVEDCIEHYTELLSLSGKRWATDKERSLLQHWSQVALGEHGEDVGQWRAFEKGPGGITLPIALLYARNVTENLPRLVRLIESAPPAVVNQWVAQVDSAGYTLPLRVLGRSFSTYTSPSAAAGVQELGAVISALDRCATLPLRWETAKRTALGLVLENVPRYNKFARGVDRDVKTFWDTLKVAEAHGLVAGEELRWRTHPNVLSDTPERKMPQWVSAPATTPVDSVVKAMDAMEELEAARGVLVRIRRNLLDERLPKSSPEVRKVRF